MSTGPSRPRPTRWRLTPLRITALYALAGALWIAFSDIALALFVRDPDTLTRLQTYKGWFYVAVTAALLFLLIRRSQAALSSSEEALRTIVESLADAVLVMDAQGNVVNVNRAALDLLGVDRKEEALIRLPDVYRRFMLRDVEGRPIPPDGGALAAALRGEFTRGREEILRRADGRDVVVSVSASPVFDATGRNLVMAVAILRDITSLKRLESLRDEFLASAAHELKTPVTTIKGHAQLLIRSPAAQEPGARAALESINRQSDRLSRRVQELLEVSRLQLGRFELHPTRFDLGELAQEAVAEMQASTVKHRLRLRREGATLVEADRDRIYQVLTNLLDNAIAFSPAGGDVEVTVGVRDGEAQVSVRDYGVGIPQERQARIFERFYRAHAGTPLDYRGMGIGLYNSREIVLRHGGRIWFESEEGKGSTFYFTLPLAGEPRSEAG